jgi:hypothetical protein
MQLISGNWCMQLSSCNWLRQWDDSLGEYSILNKVNVKFEVLTAVTIKIMIFENVMLYSLVN